MPWPTTPVPTANLDAGSDSPASARADLLATVQAVNEMMTSQLPTAQLPAAGLLPTGVSMDYFGATAPAGWVLLSGRTIGSASSGATERANADCQALFTLLWNSMADAQAPVSGGRGASAAADWAANKTITLPDGRGRATAGRDDMGGTVAGRLQFSLSVTLTSGSSAANAAISNAGLAVGMQVRGTGIPAGTTVTALSGATSITLSANATASGSQTLRFGFMDAQALGAGGGDLTQTLTTAQMPAHTHQQTGNTGQATSAGAFQIAGNLSTVAINNTQSTGGGQAHPNLPPTLVSNKIIKL